MKAKKIVEIVENEEKTGLISVKFSFSQFSQNEKISHSFLNSLVILFAFLILSFSFSISYVSAETWYDTSYKYKMAINASCEMCNSSTSGFIPLNYSSLVDFGSGKQEIWCYYNLTNVSQTVGWLYYNNDSSYTCVSKDETSKTIMNIASGNATNYGLPEDDLVFWNHLNKFNENDSSRYNSTGKWNESVKLVSGKFGNSVYSNSSLINNQVPAINFSNNKIPQMNNIINLTVLFRAKSSSFTEPDGVIVKKGGAGLKGFSIYNSLTNDNYRLIGLDNAFHNYYYNEGQEEWIWVLDAFGSESVLNPPDYLNSFSSFAMRHDDKNDTDSYDYNNQFWTNNDNIGSNGKRTGLDNIMNDTTNDLLILFGTGASYGVGKYIDELMIYNRSLSDNEIIFYSNETSFLAENYSYSASSSNFGVSVINPTNTTYLSRSINLTIAFFGSISNTWYFNGTTNITFTGTETTYYANYGSNEVTVYVNDTTGSINSSDKIIFSSIGVYPTPKFGIYYVNDSNSSSGSIRFDMACSANTAIDSVQLWGNWTGTWSANVTNGSISNNSWWNYTVTGIPNGIGFVWAVRCNDTENNIAWTSINRTFSVSKANISILTPQNLTYIKRATNVTIIISNIYPLNTTWLFNGTTNTSFTGTETYPYIMRDGQYNFTVYGNDSYGFIVSSNVVVFTVDLNYPDVIIKSESTNATVTPFPKNIFVNATMSDYFGIKNTSVYLNSSSGILLIYNSTTETNFTINFTGLTEAYYWYWIETYDGNNFLTKTAPRNVGSVWGISTHSKRKLITLNESVIFGRNLNYPVLIKTTDSNILSKSGSSGDQIYITAGDGKTPLKFYIENFNSSESTSIWIKYDIMNSSKNYIWVYYNGASGNYQDEAGTFSDYIARWSMNDLTGNDSTNKITCYPLNNLVLNKSIAGNGNLFLSENSTHYICNTSSEIQNLSEYSFEFLFFAHPSYKYKLASISFIDNPYLALGGDNGGQGLNYIQFSDGSTVGYYSGYLAGSRKWYYATYNYDNMYMKMSLDTSINGFSSSLQGYKKLTKINSTGYFFIGIQKYGYWSGPDYITGNTRQFNGTIDEMRISNFSRTNEYIKTTYYNLQKNSQFYTLGNESPPTVTITYPSNNQNYISVSEFNFTITTGYDTCWYSIDAGINYTIFNCNTSVPISLSNGLHILKVYANDSMNYISETNISFGTGNSQIVHEPYLSTTGGNTDLSLLFGETVDNISVLVTDADGNDTIHVVNITIEDPDGIIVNNASMTNSSPIWTYGTDFKVKKSGVWNITISTFDGVYSVSNNTYFNVGTLNQSIISGWYGYNGGKILTENEIVTLSNFSYDILEVEENATDIGKNWSLILSAINYSSDSNIHVGLSVVLDINYSNSSQINDIKNIIDSKFGDLKDVKYSDVVAYISLKPINTGIYTDAEISTTLNLISENITSVCDNIFIIFSRYNSSLIDTAYITNTELRYINSTTELDWINSELYLLRNTAIMNRIYENVPDLIKSKAHNYHNKVMQVMRGVGGQLPLIQPDIVYIDTNIHDLVIFNNASSTLNISVNISTDTSMASVLGRDVWEASNNYIVEQNTDGLFSVEVPAYSAETVFFEDLEKLVMTGFSTSYLYSISQPSSKAFNYTNKTTETYDGVWDIDGNNDARVQMFDSYNKKNNMIVYYGWWNNSKVTNWSEYDIIVFADHNKNELAKVVSKLKTNGKLYCYVSVAIGYNNSNDWINFKKSEIDNCLGLNETVNLNIFFDGLDMVESSTNFSDNMKVVVDYVKTTKTRDVGINTFTFYKEFCTWARPNGFCMKESCVNRWNGANPAIPDNYSRENWQLELIKSRWFEDHSVPILCQSFSNRTDDSTTFADWNEVKDVYYASKILGYDYFYVSQSDFNYAWYLRLPDVGNDLAKDYSTDDNVTYYRTFSKGIVYYNSSSGHGWVNVNRYYNSSLCLKLVDNSDVAEDSGISCSVNNGSQNYNFSASEVTWSATGIWYCKDILEEDKNTHGFYDVVCGPSNRSADSSNAIFMLYDETSGNVGGHSFYDTSTNGKPYIWNYYGNDKNWIVSINTTESREASIDTTNEITETVTKIGTRTNITFTSPYNFTIPIESYPVDIQTKEITPTYYINGNGSLNTLGYVLSSDCNSASPTFTSTAINGNSHGFCIQKIDSTTTIKFKTPFTGSLYEYMGDIYKPIISFVSPTKANASINGVNYAEINISVNDTQIHTMILNVNGVNRTLYNYASGFSSVSNPISDIWENYTQQFLSDALVHQFYVCANDTVGNGMSCTDTRYITIDTASPVISVIYPVDGVSYFDKEVKSLNFSVYDLTRDSCWYNVNETSSVYNQNCLNLSLTFSIGENNITVYVNDSLNRISSSTVLFNITAFAYTTTNESLVESNIMTDVYSTIKFDIIPSGQGLIQYVMNVTGDVNTSSLLVKNSSGMALSPSVANITGKTINIYVNSNQSSYYNITYKILLSKKINPQSCIENYTNYTTYCNKVTTTLDRVAYDYQVWYNVTDVFANNYDIIYPFETAISNELTGKLGLVCKFNASSISVSCNTTESNISSTITVATESEQLLVSAYMTRASVPSGQQGSGIDLNNLLKPITGAVIGFADNRTLTIYPQYVEIPKNVKSFAFYLIFTNYGNKSIEISDKFFSCQGVYCSNVKIQTVVIAPDSSEKVYFTLENIEGYGRTVLTTLYGDEIVIETQTDLIEKIHDFLSTPVVKFARPVPFIGMYAEYIHVIIAFLLLIIFIIIVTNWDKGVNR